MADNGTEEVDFNKLSIEDRCLHKNWKARVSGYEALTQVFTFEDANSPEFNKYLSIVRKFPTDSNAAAQEKALLVVKCFIENASPSISGRIVSEVVTGIVTKCLTSPKVRTKELAGEIILLYIEVEKHDVVMEELMKGLENKTPKIVAAVVALIRESLHQFGPKVIKLSPLIKFITSKGLEDRDKSVRDESKLLAVELYRWMLDALKTQLTGLKAVQLTELEGEFAKLPSQRAVPLRYLRSEQEQLAANDAASAGDTLDANAAVTNGVQSTSSHSEDIDPFELLDPVDILSKLPNDFYTNCESKKWQERKQALESLQDILTPNPKLASGDYGDLVKVLRKFIAKDTMIPVVAAAAKCLADLAVRLRKSFQPYAYSCLTVIFDKFKEKKPQVVTALREAADAVSLPLTLDALQEDLPSYLENKNPQIRLEVASYLTRHFAIMSPSVMLTNKKLLKLVVELLLKTLNDMDGSVREASAESLGTLMKVFGEKLLTPLLGDVDSLKMAKIKEFCDKASVKHPAPVGGHMVAGAPVATNGKQATSNGVSAKPVSKAPLSKPTSRSTSRLAAPKTKQLIVNKPLSTKSIKSKTDCGRSKPSKSTPKSEREATGAGTATITRPGPSSRLAAHQSTASLSSLPSASSGRSSDDLINNDFSSNVAIPSSTDTITKYTSASGLSRGLKQPSTKSGLRAPAVTLTRPSSTVQLQLQHQQLHLQQQRLSQQPQQHQQPPPTSQQQHVMYEQDQYSSEEFIQEPPLKSPYNEGKLATPLKPIPVNRIQPLKHSEDMYQPLQQQQIEPVISPTNSAVQLSMILVHLMSRDLDEAIDAFEDLKNIFLDPERADLLLSNKVYHILTVCTVQYKYCVNTIASSSTGSPRHGGNCQPSNEKILALCSSVTEALDVLFKHKSLSKQADRNSLMDLMPHILNILINPAIEAIPNSAGTVRAVNVLATTIVLNSHPNAMVPILIKLLHECFSGGPSFNNSPNYTEMLLKCIWKVTRFLPKVLSDIDLDQVLLDIHNFMTEFPSEFWRADAARNDIPLRTVKTLTYIMVQSLRSSVLQHLTLIPNPSESCLVRYIHRLLRDCP